MEKALEDAAQKMEETHDLTAAESETILHIAKKQFVEDMDIVVGICLIVLFSIGLFFWLEGRPDLSQPQALLFSVGYGLIHPFLGRLFAAIAEAELNFMDQILKLEQMGRFGDWSLSTTFWVSIFWPLFFIPLLVFPSVGILCGFIFKRLLRF
jgi:hypothetical protein